ncbi:homeobox protein ceh-63-like [Oculina patagonica]
MDGALPPMYCTTQWLNAASHFPPWLLGTRFMRFLPGVTPYLRRRRNVRKRKQRPLFTQQQVQALEQEFTRHRYVSEEKRAELASTLNLTETQVKTWFQNRRTKWRKEARDEMETALMDSKRRWKNEAEKQQSLPTSSTPNSQTSSSARQSQVFIDLDSYKLKIAQKV